MVRSPDPEIFELQEIRRPRLPGGIVDEAIEALQEVTPETALCGGSRVQARVELLRRRLQKARQNGWDWEEVTRVPRREWTLIRLYTLYLGDDGAEGWLRPFDDFVADSVLGGDPLRWHRSRRREVTHLFFVQFDRIECLGRLARDLRQAWNARAAAGQDPASVVWRNNANLLFSEDGPQLIAGRWRQGESIDGLATRFHVHRTSSFRDCLYEAVLLRQLSELPLFGPDPDLFKEVEREKEKVFRGGRHLGSKAVEILVKRVVSDAGGAWKDEWSRRIVPLACDPRTLDPAERNRWWGWASEAERETARRALTGLNIKEFLRLLGESLPDTGNKRQFVRRSDFLLKLFENRVIQDAKLVVREDVHHSLESSTRESLQPSWCGGAEQRTSFVCLKCTGDIYLIEGTHDFGLRAFHGKDSFPIVGFWSSAPSRFGDHQLRVPPDRCGIFQPHLGEWESSFLRKIRSKFHVEWPRLS